MSKKRVLLVMDEEDIKKEVFWGKLFICKIQKKTKLLQKIGD
jgi:hypothetical protein